MLGELCIVWGIGIIAASTILYVVSVIYRPDPFNDPDMNPYRDEYG